MSETEYTIFQSPRNPSPPDTTLPDTENPYLDMPLLEDLYNALRAQDEKEAQYIATALEIYVTGSLNVFNHHTNVDVNSRIVCYDIKELGKQLKKIGMLVVQDVRFVSC